MRAFMFTTTTAFLLVQEWFHDEFNDRWNGWEVSCCEADESWKTTESSAHGLCTLLTPNIV